MFKKLPKGEVLLLHPPCYVSKVTRVDFYCHPIGWVIGVHCCSRTYFSMMHAEYKLYFVWLPDMTWADNEECAKNPRSLQGHRYVSEHQDLSLTRRYPLTLLSLFQCKPCMDVACRQLMTSVFGIDFCTGLLSNDDKILSHKNSLALFLRANKIKLDWEVAALFHYNFYTQIWRYFFMGPYYSCLLTANNKEPRYVVVKSLRKDSNSTRGYSHPWDLKMPFNQLSTVCHTLL